MTKTKKEGTNTADKRQLKKRESQSASAINELGHDPIQVPVDSLKPSPENDALYRPVDWNDPSIVALAESIAQHGVKEPLVATTDGYIISGHRRHAAARLAGLATVPCRYEQFRRVDDRDRFMLLLREYNRQRVKSFDEQLREEVLSCNPEEAYREMLAYRDRKAGDAIATDTIAIPVVKARSAISEAKRQFLSAIQSVIESQRLFWPLTDRRIHYALLNDPPLIHASKPGHYENNQKSYKSLVELLTRARLEGEIPMECIYDPTRPVTLFDVHRCPQDFARKELNDFLKGYFRDLMQSQPNHIEIIGEKNTVLPILKPVAGRYCIPLTIGRGYCSLPPRSELAERFESSGKERLVLLLVTDFDPDGEQIATSFAASMQRDFHIDNIEAIKVALTWDQVNTLALPPAMKAKQGSANYRKFCDKYGDDVYELEAVPPPKLQEILTEAIDSVLDVDLFNAEIDADRRDAEFLENTRRRTSVALAGVVGEGGGVDVQQQA